VRRCIECNGSHDVRSGLCTLCRGELEYLAAKASPERDVSAPNACRECGHVGDAVLSTWGLSTGRMICAACRAEKKVA
jgi:hypothetical protein